MITINKLLISDETFTLIPDEEVYIQLWANITNCILSTKILTSGGTYSVQSTIESKDFFDLTTTTHSDIQWEYIKIDGIEYTELNEDIKSLEFVSPSILYIKNTSLTQSIRFSLRGNK